MNWPNCQMNCSAICQNWKFWICPETIWLNCQFTQLLWCITSIYPETVSVNCQMRSFSISPNFHYSIWVKINLKMFQWISSEITQIWKRWFGKMILAIWQVGRDIFLDICSSKTKTWKHFHFQRKSKMEPFRVKMWRFLKISLKIKICKT